MITVILPDSIRSKKNSKRVYKRGKHTIVKPSEAYEKWELAARLSVRRQLARVGHVHPLEVGVSVCVTAYYRGQQPDLSGVLESVGDCLEGYLWANDKQILSWDGSRLIHDKDNPRTVVTVREGE